MKARGFTPVDPTWNDDPLNNPANSATAQSEIAVMWDTVCTNNGIPVVKEYNHLPLMANILFFDGHAEVSQYPQPAGSPVWMLTEAATRDDHPNFP
ncbi:MAG: hypothetical protein GWP08_15870 [Nitrospiraceae bacterium]|nr:hypothetical protein [Nitrospiraceae bacterium]